MSLRGRLSVLLGRLQQSARRGGAGLGTALALVAVPLLSSSQRQRLAEVDAEGDWVAPPPPDANLTSLSLSGFDEEGDTPGFHDRDKYDTSGGGGGGGGWDDGEEESGSGSARPPPPHDAVGRGRGAAPRSGQPSSASSAPAQDLARALEEAFGGGRPPPPGPPSAPPAPRGGGGGAAPGGGAVLGGDFEARKRVLLARYGSLDGLQAVSNIILANACVWLGWKVPLPTVRAFLERNFLTSPLHMAARGFPAGWATCLWSTYSHASLLHLAANMLGLGSFGPGLMDARSHSVSSPALSALSFMGMYHAGGVLGSGGSNLFSAACGSSRPALGASGAVFAVITYHTLCHPQSGVAVLFFIHSEASTALAFATLVNLGLSARQWSMARKGLLGPAVDGTAHLVGTVVGGGWYAAARAGARAGGAPAKPTQRTATRSAPPTSVRLRPSAQPGRAVEL